MEGSHLEKFKELTAYVDTNGFAKKKNDVIKLLMDPELPSEVGIIISDWFFRTISRLYKVRGSDRTLIMKKSKRCYRRAKNIILKATYLKYLDDDAIKELCRHFYFKRFGDEKYFVLQLQNDVTLVKLLYNDPELDDDELIDHFCSWIEASELDTQRSDLLDVLLRHYPSDERVKEIHESMKFKDKNNKGIYGNDQNVHDEEITKGVENAAQKLMFWYKDHRVDDQEIESLKGDWGEWIRKELAQMKIFVSDKDREAVKSLIIRATIDHTVFGYPEFSILDFIVALLKFIRDMPSPKLVYTALKEEILIMTGLCSSGYITRGISVLQGIPGAEDFSVTISERKRLFSVVSSKLAEKLSRAGDKVTLGSYDPTYAEEYLNFLEMKLNEIISTGGLPKEDFDFTDLPSIMDEYSGYKGWSFSEGKIKRPVLE